MGKFSLGDQVEAVRLWLRDVPLGLRTFVGQDLRWSYLVMGVLVLAGVVVNVFVPSGWTVWPIVAAVGIMLYVHEASERNGQGIPPLQVYALFIGGIFAWGLMTAILKALNPWVVLAGMAYVTYYAVKEHIKQREAEKLVEGRKAAGQCVHCGEPADPRYLTCPHCGEEPDPQGLQVQRVAAIVRARKGASSGRTREVLTRTKATALAAQKEAGLVARRQAKTQRRY
jgi:hypothetical protein